MEESVNKKQNLLASLGLLIVSILWGYAFVVRKATVEEIPPMYMLVFRFSIGAVGLIAIFHRKLKGLTKNDFTNGAILGLLVFISYLLQNVGAKYTTASKNAFLTCVFVVAVPLLNWVLNKKRPDIYSAIASVMTISGVGLLSLQGDVSVNFGDILTLLCAVSYALHMIYISKFTEKHDPIVLAILQLAVAAIISCVAAPIVAGPLPVNILVGENLKALLYMGFVSTLIGFLLQNVCQKYTTPATASLMLSLESVFAAVFAAILLKESFNTRTTIGCIIIFAAIILAQTKLSFLRRKPI